MRVGSVLRDQRPHGGVGDSDDRNVRRARARRARVGLMIERDARAVGRPRKRADRERAAGQGADRARGAVKHEQLRHAIVLLDDLKLAVLLVAILHAGGLRISRRVRDACAIRRPREAADVILQRRQRLGFAAGGVDHIDLALVRAIGNEREPGSIGRPCRRLARLLGGCSRRRTATSPARHRSSSSAISSGGAGSTATRRV